MASLNCTFEGALAVITLAQPERGNPLDRALITELKERVLWLWQCEGLRCVLLRGEGRNFSFGGDLRSLQAPEGGLPALVHDWTSDLHMALQRLWTLPVPLVVQVQGAVMGGSLSLMAGCDVVVAAEGSKFGSAFAKIGLSCDSGTSATLTSRMGMARARRFVLMAEVMDTAATLAAGLVDKVVPSGRLEDETVTIARQFAQGPTRAYGELKRLFLRAGASQLHTATASNPA